MGQTFSLIKDMLRESKKALNFYLNKLFSKKEKSYKDKNEVEETKPNDDLKKEKSKKSFSNQVIDFFNTFFRSIENVLFKFQPKIYSIAQESNIMRKYDDNFIITKDFNLCFGVKLSGISYASINENEEIDLAESRNRFFSRLDDSIEMTIIAKKELEIIHNDTKGVKNPHAKKIIELWEKEIPAYTINYYLILSTKTKHIAGFFEGIKDKATTEKRDEEKTSTKTQLELKFKKLNELKISLFNDLGSFKPRMLDSNELINVFASYANCQKTNLRYTDKLITDSYLSSHIELKKDYIYFHRNIQPNKYGRFISIKAYENDIISSIIGTSLLRENSEFTILVHCEAVQKDKAIKRVREVKAFTQEIYAQNLDLYIQDLRADRQNMMMVSFSVFVEADSLEELEEQSDIVKGLLENQSVIAVKETLNQNPLFFSFFPSRGNLNARKRSLQSKNLSSLITFENDVLGFKKNAWGDTPITTFQHLSGSPFLFNFHDSERIGAVGHTLVIGGTGFGKTTIMQFLMMNLFKYNINIFAMDKSQGMQNFTTYIDGEYHDFTDEDNKFKLNPFLLEDTEENNLFLATWLNKMGSIDPEIKEEHIDYANIVRESINSLRRSVSESQNNRIPTLSEFHSTLTYGRESSKEGSANVRQRYERYIKGFFDNEEDGLNFKKQLTVLGMDTILQDEKLCGLSALYIFHKIANISKAQNKGFFIFVDELKDYLRDETMRESIIKQIVESRKIGGVITMGLQNIDFLNEIPKADTLISQMANYIIFPTSDDSTLENMQRHLKLTNSEIDFLKQTPKESRQILYKQVNLQQSSVLDINLMRLNSYLKVFSSERTDVLRLKELKKKYPNEWRTKYVFENQTA